MGAVSERLNVTIEQARLYLRAEPYVIENELLAASIDAAKEDADGYLNNDFTREDEDGNIIELPIPQRVRMWVLQNAARDYELRTNGLHQESSGVGMATWSDRKYKDIAKWRRNPGY